jgi:Uri superfamily endonuclease
LDPLQKDVERMIEKMQAEKWKIEQIHAECIEVLENHITAQSVEKLAKQRAQVKEKVTQLVKVF